MANSTFGPGISGFKAVTTAQQRESLGVSNGKRYKSITIVAERNNTGLIYVGGDDVASTTNTGLAAGAAQTWSSDHGWTLDEIYLDASVDTDGADFYGAY